MLLLVYFLAALAGAPLWPMLAKKLGKHKALVVAAVLYAFVQVAAVFMPAGSSMIGIFVLVLAGLPYSAAPVLVRSMMADIGDEERLESGVDKTGLLYAIVTGTVKLGYALAVAVFIALGWMGFDPKVTTPEGDAALIGMYAIAPAVLGLVVAAIMMRYRWTRPVSPRSSASLRRGTRRRRTLPSPQAPRIRMSPQTPPLAPRVTTSTRCSP